MRKMLKILMKFEQKSHLKSCKITKNTVFCTKIIKSQKNVLKPFAIYSILCYNIFTRKTYSEMNKLFQSSYFRHDIFSMLLYNVCDELDKRKGEQYL